jgi:hypothetical protein
MIKVDPQEFMEQGYIIVRQLVPPDLLKPLQDSSETVMHRRWPEGIPPETFQPMIHGLERWIDADSQSGRVLFARESIRADASVDGWRRSVGKWG